MDDRHSDREVLREVHALRHTIDRLFEHVVHAHWAEMRKIDRETNEIGKQLDELAAGANAEQAAKLRAHAARLRPIGVVPDQPPPIPAPPG